MAAKAPFKTTFAASEVIRPIFTGGDVAIENDARIFATTLGEDAILTDIKTGKHLAKVEGVCSPGHATLPTWPLTANSLGWRAHINTNMSLSMRIYSLNKTADSIDPQLVRTVRPHATPVVVLAVDRTSTLLATGGTDGSIKVWDINGGYVTHTFRGPSVLVSALLFFELATGPKKQSESRRKYRLQQDSGLLRGGQDGKVRVWDLHKRSVVANLDSHVSDVRGLDYSATQNTLVTASRDKTIRWWDARSWKPRKVIPCFELVEAVGFIGDGQLTFTAGSNGCLRIWQTDTGRELTREQKEKLEAEAFVAAVYRPGFPFIACVQADHTIALFNTPVEGTTSTIAPPEPFHRISGTHDDIIDLRYLLPDRSVMALATNSEDIRIVSVSESGDSAALASSEYFGQDVALLKGHDDIIITLDVDWSGYWVATGAKDNTAKIWRVDPKNNSFTCWATFQGHAESVSAVAMPRTRPVDGSKAHADPLNHPPQFLVTGSSDQTIKRWEIPKEPQARAKSGIRASYTRKAHDKDINAIDVSNNAQLFASASQDKVVKIWSIEEGEVQGILRGHRRGVWSVSFAPQNTPALQGEQGSVSGKGVVITGSGDKTVKLWSLTDYTCLRTFEGHANSVLKVAWLNIPPPEERSKKPILIASAGGDGLVKVWDINSGENECTLDNHEDRVWALAVHPDTNTIVSGSGDSTVTFWKDTSAETQTASNEAALKLIEQEQELDNYEYAGAYREAITLALQLNHPRKLQSLFEKVIDTKTPDVDSLTGSKAVDEVLATLSDDQLFLLLLRLRDWNTNARTAPMAQRILWTVVKSYPVSRLSGLSVKGAKGQKSVKEVLNALKVYTERHYKRMEDLVDESYLVEYTLREMDALAPSLDNMKLTDGETGLGGVVRTQATMWRKLIKISIVNFWSVASKHLGLRAQQIDRYGRSSSIIRSLRDNQSKPRGNINSTSTKPAGDATNESEQQRSTTDAPVQADLVSGTERTGVERITPEDVLTGLKQDGNQNFFQRGSSLKDVTAQRIAVRRPDQSAILAHVGEKANLDQKEASVLVDNSPEDAPPGVNTNVFHTSRGSQLLEGQGDALGRLRPKAPPPKPSWFKDFGHDKLKALDEHTGGKPLPSISKAAGQGRSPVEESAAAADVAIASPQSGESPKLHVEEELSPSPAPKADPHSITAEQEVPVQSQESQVSQESDARQIEKEHTERVKDILSREGVDDKKQPDSIAPLLDEPSPKPYVLRESKVPATRLSRIWNYGGLAAGMLGGALTEGISRGFGGGGQGSVMFSAGNMERLVAKLSRMRGAALKLGQLMSFQDAKMLPEPIRDVLQRVQDRADYMPAWQRDRVLVASLGPEWRDLFEDFEETPIAAASIGQVHRADA
ncbi:hypothetical protein NUW58_g8247 [Xylaria curta]|uniref:Uncharacterized protein n=1 Tax=Xylaria curta TaxID=42375 RepID=A0ACC1N991_9PEZI|nr:hypothetical protein NUW58_g8247 [Xylaria curta]